MEQLFQGIPGGVLLGTLFAAALAAAYLLVVQVDINV